MVRRWPEPSDRLANFILGAIVLVSTLVALAWVFYVPMFEAPDETVHFEYSAALYSAGGLIAPRDANLITVPRGRPVPYPAYLEDQSAVAVIAQKPDVKAPAGYGSSAYYSSVDSSAPVWRSDQQLLSPPLLRYYPFGYYLLDAAVMGVTALFTTSQVALFFAARSLSALLLALSLLLTFLLLRRLGTGRPLALALTGAIGLFPMTTMLSSSVQSDSLSFTLATLALLAALELRRRPHSMRWLAILGVALGLLLVTKVHFFAIVAAAIGAMIVSQRLDMRDARGWPRELAVLVLPAIVLESIQAWTQWGSPPLIAPAQLGDLGDYRSAIAGGPVAIAGYIAHVTTFSFLDHSFGREFSSFWGAFGWVDTPLVLGSPFVTVAVWFLIAGFSIALLGCTLIRLGQVAFRLFRVARRGRVRRALRIAFSNPVAMSFFLLAAFLFSVEGYPGIQGRYYFPLLPAVFWIALKYAPRALPGKFGPALFRMQAAGLVAYSLAGAIFAFPTLTDRFYAHGRDLVSIVRANLADDPQVGHYQVTRLRLPEGSLGVGRLQPDRVAVVGWAVDDQASSAAKTVFIDVDGAQFQQAVYGDDSPQAVTALGSTRYASCGFDVILDTTRLTPGPHLLTVRVVSADGRRLYAPGPPLEFVVGASVGPGLP
jgi:4-amino-4-deoxy-L-arabinose transferase-like glycosyltransferase